PYALIDVRDEEEYNTQQIFTANLVPRRLLELRIGQLVPVTTTRVVICDDDGQRAALAAAALEHMGYSRVAVMAGGLIAWLAAGYPTVSGVNVPSKDFGERVLVQHHVPEMPPEELHARLQRGEKIVILDSRTPEEFERACIPGGRSVPGGELALRITDLVKDPKATVIVNCAGRTRSIIGTRVLQRMGIPNPIYGLRNGTMGWHLAGFQVQTGARAQPLPTPSAEGLAAAEAFAASVAAEDGVRLLSVQALPGLLTKADRETVYLIDVRTSEEYSAGHIPGAQWIPGGQAVQRTDEVIAVRNAAIVVTCDGRVRSFITASWYRQMGFPNVYALDGGTTAWTASGLPLETGWPQRLPAAFAEAKAQIQPLSPHELQARLAGSRASLVIDIDTSRDHSQGHVPGARWLARGWLELRISDIAAAEDTPIALTCQDGVKSTLAGAALKGLGYTNICVLAGGMASWKQAGLPLETGLTQPVVQPADVLRSGTERSREEMIRYLEWEEELGRKYETRPA
ncbi:MAG: sulfurtransferase, partial [Nitrospinae bacterium]|nr:sulfurtransferase [Nitrospinota bacterium]